MRLLLFLILPFCAFSQYSTQPSASTIKLKLKKLNFLGSVLYVAAHPDDENTRAITYFSNDRLAATAYLSMTRGDGGQNLIGPEIRDELGLIRTQELLAARRIDGGQQFFTRANDFGYSKSATETFSIWGKENMLSDVVRIYRQYQPDVIITRFPPDERAGHGHHTASALLAQEAFDLSNSTTHYVDQLSEFSVWQPKRIFINTGRWWNQSVNENTPGVISFNVGAYNSLLGTSYTEIAAISRSQHKSQGFGSKGMRGDQLEYLEFVKGEKVDKDVFDNINTSWTRLAGGEKVKVLVERAISEFKDEDPALSVPLLIQIRTQISALETSVWKHRKLEEVNDLIRVCLGFFAEATADQYWASPERGLVVSMEIVNRSSTALNLLSVKSNELGFDSILTKTLVSNKPLQFKIKQAVVAGLPYSSPYWLQQPHTLGTFKVPNPSFIGKPENEAAIKVAITIQQDKVPLTFQVPVIFKTVDPVKGELNRAVEVVPPVFVNLQEEVIIVSNSQPREVKVTIKSATPEKATGTLHLSLPDGWRTEPQKIDFQLGTFGEEQTKTFIVHSTEVEGTFKFGAYVQLDGKMYQQALRVIAYDHIPVQTLTPNAEAALVRLNLKKEGKLIGYIKGAGDDVPAALRNMGYEVWEMKNNEITAENLKRLDAVILGIRAVNTNDRLRFVMSDLLNYVKQGGTMVVQYNTNFDYETDVFSPYPLTLSRDRVTQEDAEVRLLKPEHPLLNYPNKITKDDFNGWVQERGLYFPSKWDSNFEALLSMNDTGENSKEGSLLVAKYGEGQYIYTGLSFFRELPEGVGGAYKLFANIVSAGKTNKVSSSKSKKKSN